jgi:hypothetical protein
MEKGILLTTQISSPVKRWSTLIEASGEGVTRDDSDLINN